jgi:predicted PurR-regulated permease PerM
MPLPPGHRDLPRLVLGVLLMTVMIGGTLWILSPFLPSLVWATMIVVTTWPLLLRLQRALRGSRKLAVTVMVALLLVIVIAPLVLAVSTIADQADRISRVELSKLHIPAPPDWIRGVPAVGEKVAAEWQALASATPEELATKATPYVRPVVSWIAAQAGNAGMFMANLLLTLLLCAVLYVTGETAAQGVRRFARRLHGEAGDNAVLLAAGSIRAVALGIVVTAIVQTSLGALGLLIASVPYVAVLAALMFVFCIAQIGPTLPLLAAIGWLYYTDQTVAAVALLVWTVLVASLDNVLRPLLIRRGADLPLLLIMAGVIGGLLTFGLMGLFVGPVLLAVTYKQVGAWVAEQDQSPR